MWLRLMFGVCERSLNARSHASVRHWAAWQTFGKITVTLTGNLPVEGLKIDQLQGGITTSKQPFMGFLNSFIPVVMMLGIEDNEILRGCVDIAN